MSRNFLFLVLALLLCVVTAVWWMGLPLANLAFFDDRRTDPYLLLDMYNSEQPQAYADALQPAIEGLDASRVGPYQLAYMLVGRQQEQRDWLGLVAFRQASSVVRLLTDVDYLADRDTHVNRQTLVGAAAAPRESWPAVLVLVLLIRSDLDEGDPLVQFYDINRDPGEHLLAADVDALDKSAQWQQGLVLGFASLGQANDWLRGTDGRIRLEVLKARTRDLQISVYQRPTP